MLFKLNVKFCAAASRDLIMGAKFCFALPWIIFGFMLIASKTIIRLEQLILYFNVEQVKVIYNQYSVIAFFVIYNKYNDDLNYFKKSSLQIFFSILFSW